MHRKVPRVLGALLTAAALTLTVAAPASAHVTVHSEEAEKGGYAKLTFRVPTESEKAGTVKVAVHFGTKAPLGSVSTTPMAGWTSKVTKKKLDEPVNIGGYEITEAVTKVTWTADKGVRVGPGKFEEFAISTGPLPSTVDHLSFPATQTYDDGTVVRWDDPVREGKPEPEHPAPTIALADPRQGSGGEQTGRTVDDVDQSGTGSDTGDVDDASAPADSTARTLGAVGLGVGALALIVAVVVAVRARQRREDT